MQMCVCVFCCVLVLDSLRGEIFGFCVDSNVPSRLFGGKVCVGSVAQTSILVSCVVLVPGRFQTELLAAGDVGNSGDSGRPDHHHPYVQNVIVADRGRGGWNSVWAFEKALCTRVRGVYVCEWASSSDYLRYTRARARVCCTCMRARVWVLHVYGMCMRARV